MLENRAARGKVALATGFLTQSSHVLIEPGNP